MKLTFLLLLLTLIPASAFSQEVDSTELRQKAIEEGLIYKTGSIELESNNATLTVPHGFRFLDKEQSIYVLSDLWGNPKDSTILGMLVPENKGVLDMDAWVFTLSFDEMGFVKDDDAEDINYDDLLKEQQKETTDANPERIKLGYAPIEFIGWASKPFYDKEKKILHWAKELKFGEDSLHTLNYNLRILGRKGIFIVNAVASMNELNVVNSELGNVASSIEFKDGNKYADFKPGVDQVAAWTIGGLVAGKILAKVGFFALLVKFWKLIALAVVGAGSAVWRFITGRKKEEVTGPKA
jgi:uncharacterized membrane-anchored protein